MEALVTVDWRQILKGWVKVIRRDFYIRRMGLLADDRLCCMLQIVA